MKNKFFIIIPLGIMMLFTISGCEPNTNKNSRQNILPETESKDTKQLEVKSISVQKGSYTGNTYKGNYIYSSAMNLAWNELRELMKPVNTSTIPLVKLKTEDKNALSTTDKLNHSLFSKDDLNEESYYVKSGYGKKTLETINKEVRQKFPQKTFNDLEFDIPDEDFIVYAYLFKQVKYLIPFDTDEVYFNNERVKGFTAKNNDQKKNIKVIDYLDEDKFIISINLKENNEELFLAKGYNMNSPDEVLETLAKKTITENSATQKTDQQENFKALPPPPFPVYAPYLTNDDTFSMPSLNFDYHREYEEMSGKTFANEGFEDKAIGAMYENIRFALDSEGAKVENEAVIVSETAAPAPQPPAFSRNFILNKPFWVIMKQKSSNQPYFLLGVNNSEFMEKTD